MASHGKVAVGYLPRLARDLADGEFTLRVSATDPITLQAWNYIAFVAL